MGIACIGVIGSQWAKTEVRPNDISFLKGGSR